MQPLEPIIDPDVGDANKAATHRRLDSLIGKLETAISVSANHSETFRRGLRKAVSDAFLRETMRLRGVHISRKFGTLPLLKTVAETAGPFLDALRSLQTKVDTKNEILRTNSEAQE